MELHACLTTDNDIPESTAGPDPDRIVRPKAAESLTGLSGVTIWRLRKKGDFPPLVRLTPTAAGKNAAIGWRRSDLMAWLRARECK
jgi:predicted DNA-binding transcriptional regulator AlpA